MNDNTQNNPKKRELKDNHISQKKQIKGQPNNNKSNDGNNLDNPRHIYNHINSLNDFFAPLKHEQLLSKLLEMVKPLDFASIAQVEPKKLKDMHYQIITVEEILNLAKENSWGICQKHEFIYLYNGAYWNLCGVDDLKRFLGLCAEKMGVNQFKAKQFLFRDNLYKQFIVLSNLTSPNIAKDNVLINLENGTFEVSAKGGILRSFDPNDFLTYQLSFKYDPKAEAPIFKKYLDRVLPDQQMQKVLAEFLAYIFIKPNILKLEKTLILFGSGANGKSVLYEIVRHLLGAHNTSEYSLQSLTNTNGYYRAMLSNKLVNFASEINGKLEVSIFKQLVSGEAVEARLPYGNPLILTDYAKLIFNTNELPKDVEQTHAFFRRFLIIPFNVTIPESEQDRQLSSKIVANELSGVFNWILNVLDGLLERKQFSDCDALKNALEEYRLNSDSVRLFLDENGYQASPDQYNLIKDLYFEYRAFCVEDGLRPVSKVNFKKRLEGIGIAIERINSGNVAYISSTNPSNPF